MVNEIQIADKTTLDIVNTNIGSKTDTASATGSLHAKVKDLKDNGSPAIQKPRGAAGTPGSCSNTGTSYNTALNITGKGKLKALAIYRAGGSTSVIKLRLTIDGVVVAEGCTPNITNTYYYPLPLFLLTNAAATQAWDTAANDGKANNAEISFKSSLKIEICAPTGTSSYGTVYWQYEKE